MKDFRQSAARWAIRIGAVVFGVSWTSGVCGFALYLAPELLREVRKPLVYRPVSARVTACTPAGAKPEGTDVPPFERGTIAYAYRLDGRTYEGNHEQPAEDARLNEYSRKLTGPFEPGQAVEAWYDPADLSVSTLEPIAQPQVLGLVIFLMPFLAIGVGLVLLGLTGWGLPKDLLAAGLRGEGGLREGPAAYLGPYAVLSALGAFGLMLLGTVIDWRTAWAIGISLLLGLPVAALRIGRAIRRTARREGPAETPPSAAVHVPLLSKSFYFVLFFGLFWNGITSVFAVHTFGVLIRHGRAALRFQPVEGEVLASRVLTSDSDDRVSYRPKITYRYEVAGREYTSRRFSYDTTYSSDRTWTDRMLREHPPGRKVTVHYDPGNPSDAILHLQVPPMAWFNLVFLQPFLLVGIGMAVAAVCIPLRHAAVRRFLAASDEMPTSIPGWGRIVHDGRGWHVRAGGGRLVPVVAFAGGYGATCFLSIFVVGFLLGGPENASATVAGGILGGGAVLGLLAARAMASRSGRKAMLLVDPLRRLVSLVRPGGEQTVVFAEIEHWLLRSIGSQGSEDSGPSYRPLLMIRTQAGLEVPVHLFGSDEMDLHVARRAGRLFAAATAGTVVEEATPAADARLPASLRGAVRFLRHRARGQNDFGQDYDDLS
ncbi:MAG TPA: DUF3592 domain-containing protein [Phycisphaerae bacterium]|nr:DUF3592 domain-containing protein [Phycisphaerae bacterium]